MEKTNIPELDKLFLDVGYYRKSSELYELFKGVPMYSTLQRYVNAYSNS